MWIERTPTEVAKWHEATQRDARSHGRFIAGIVWVLVSAFVAGGWFVSFRAGVASQQSQPGNFWIRLPLVALIALPFAWFVFRTESRKEMEKLDRATICPKCDTASDTNPGAPCQCGGQFVPQSSLKWIDD